MRSATRRPRTLTIPLRTSSVASCVALVTYNVPTDTCTRPVIDNPQSPTVMLLSTVTVPAGADNVTEPALVNPAYTCWNVAVPPSNVAFAVCPSPTHNVPLLSSITPPSST